MNNYYPILMVVGPAGSGKDTVASMVAKATGATCIAQADPMKRLAAQLFGFTEDQLWGPSERRNALDPRWTPERLTSALEDYDAPHKPHLPTGSQLFVTRWLKDVLPGQDLVEARVGLECWYADVLREGWRRCGLSPRLVLQTLGTEWGRAFSKNMWVDYAMSTAAALLGGEYMYERQSGLVSPSGDTGVSPSKLVIVTDGRFRNEVLAIRRLGGSVWQVVPPRVDTEATGTAGIAGHTSETEQQGIPEEWYTLKIVNDKNYGLATLEGIVKVAVEKYLKSKPATLASISFPQE